MIPTYTIAVVAALVAVFLSDRALGTRVYQKKGFALALGMALAFQLLFDNGMASIGFWQFNPAVTLGVFVPFIPLENLGFGAALFWTVCVLYEIS